MLRKSRCDSQNLSIFFNFTIYVTIHVTVHSNPNLNFHLCFHCQTLLILVPFGNPKIPIIFWPISHQNLTLNPQNKSNNRSAPIVLNQILFISPCPMSSSFAYIYDLKKWAVFELIARSCNKMKRCGSSHTFFN